MKTSILIGLLSLFFLSCNQEDETLVDNGIENELLILKNKYGIKYEKRELTNLPKKASSIDDLKRFFASFEAQRGKIRNMTRSDWEGHHFPKIEEADCVGIPTYLYVNQGNDNLWSSLTVYGITILDDIEIAVSCSFIRDTTENRPVTQNTNIRVQNETTKGYMTDCDGDENSVLFILVSDVTFDIIEKVENGYIQWGVMWVFGISGILNIQNHQPDVWITTRNYDEFPDYYYDEFPDYCN